MDHISKSLLPELLLLTSFILYQGICKQHGEDSQAYELILIPRTKELKKKYLQVITQHLLVVGKS